VRLKLSEGMAAEGLAELRDMVERMSFEISKKVKITEIEITISTEDGWRKGWNKRL